MCAIQVSHMKKGEKETNLKLVKIFYYWHYCVHMFQPLPNRISFTPTQPSLCTPYLAYISVWSRGPASLLLHPPCSNTFFTQLSKHVQRKCRPSSGLPYVWNKVKMHYCDRHLAPEPALTMSPFLYPTSVDSQTPGVWTAWVHLYIVFNIIKKITRKSIPCYFLNNISLSLAYLIVRIQYIIHKCCSRVNGTSSTCLAQSSAH